MDISACKVVEFLTNLLPSETEIPYISIYHDLMKMRYKLETEFLHYYVVKEKSSNEQKTI